MYHCASVTKDVPEPPAVVTTRTIARSMALQFADHESTIFWDVAHCNLIPVYRRFRRKFKLIV